MVFARTYGLTFLDTDSVVEASLGDLNTLIQSEGTTAFKEKEGIYESVNEYL